MPRLTNRTAAGVDLPALGLHLDAGATIDIDDAAAARLAGHPVLEVADDPPLDVVADVPPAEPAISAPAADSQEGSP